MDVLQEFRRLKQAITIIEEILAVRVRDPGGERVRQCPVEQKVDVSPGSIRHSLTSWRQSRRARIQQRTAEHIVDHSRIQIVEQTVDVPGRGRTSCGAAPSLEAAEVPVDGFSAHFPKEKSAKSGRQTSANLLSHSSPSTGEAYADFLDSLTFEELQALSTQEKIGVGWSMGAGSRSSS